MKYVKETRKILFFCFIGIMIASLFAYSFWGNQIPLNEIRDYVNAAEFAPFVFIPLYAGLSIFIPTTPMMAIAGILFGFKYGLLYTTIAGFISAIVTFYLARFLGKPFVDNILEHKKSLALLEKYDEKIGKHGIATVIVMRMLPIMPFNVLNLFMGISKVSLYDYAIGTVIGLAPSNILAIYFGTLVLTEEFREISLALSILMTIAVLAWFAFRILMVWKYFKKGKKQEE